MQSSIMIIRRIDLLGDGWLTPAIAFFMPVPGEDPESPLQLAGGGRFYFIG